MTDPIGTAQELIERLKAASKGHIQATHQGYYGICQEAADALQSRITEVAELREKLAFLDAELSCCNENDGHYCPNCDRSLYAAKLVASAALSRQKE